MILLKCIIVDDDYAFAIDTKMKAEQIGLEVVKVVTDYTELTEVLEENPSLDVILSDVKLNDGVYAYDFFNKIKNLPPIILFSAYTDMEMYNSSKSVNPYIYLLKPFDVLTLRSAVDGALRDKLQLDHTREHKGDIHNADNVLYVRSKGKLIPLNPSRITYIFSEGNYCYIYSLGDHKVVIRSSIKNVLEKVNSSSFIQVHRAHVINLRMIETVDISNNEVILKDKIIPVGRKYKKSLVEAISR